MTKKQRNIIYKKALRNLSARHSDTICRSICKVVKPKHWRKYGSKIPTLYPELWLFAPIKHVNIYEAWIDNCSDEAYMIRELILMSCIQLTN